METRPYFFLGDLLSSLVTGWITAMAVVHWIPWQASHLLVMLAGMVLGMGVGLVATFLFMPFFGAMEVMLPVMLAGMLSGMFLSMGLSMAWFPQDHASFWGAILGVGAFAWTSVVHWRVGGVYEN